MAQINGTGMFPREVVQLSHQNLLTNAEQRSAGIEITDGDVFASYRPARNASRIRVREALVHAWATNQSASRALNTVWPANFTVGRNRLTAASGMVTRGAHNS
jgi:hypothetical protein